MSSDIVMHLIFLVYNNVHIILFSIFMVITHCITATMVCFPKKRRDITVGQKKKKTVSNLIF